MKFCYCKQNKALFVIGGTKIEQGVTLPVTLPYFAQLIPICKTFCKTPIAIGVLQRNRYIY